jgi:hypothetical protein
MPRYQSASAVNLPDVQGNHLISGAFGHLLISRKHLNQ